MGTFHTYSERSRGYLWAWPWVRLVWSRLHARVAVSEAAREFATRYHQANFRILPNAVDVPLTPSPAPGGPGPLRVLFVGRLDDRRKGFGVLVEALQRLEARAPDTVVVTAVGPGTRTWEPRIPPALPLTLRGQVADDELAAAYRACDLVVVPSLGGESFGLVPLEAMAQQRPVVASRIPGYAAWLDGATRLVEPGDPEALAVALAELAVDEPTRAALARKGRAVAEEYAWPAQAERWAELYRSG